MECQYEAFYAEFEDVATVHAMLRYETPKRPKRGQKQEAICYIYIYMYIYYVVGCVGARLCTYILASKSQERPWMHEGQCDHWGFSGALLGIVRYLPMPGAVAWGPGIL